MVVVPESPDELALLTFGVWLIESWISSIPLQSLPIFGCLPATG